MAESFSFEKGVMEFISCMTFGKESPARLFI